MAEFDKWNWEKLFCSNKNKSFSKTLNFPFQGQNDMHKNNSFTLLYKIYI